MPEGKLTKKIVKKTIVKKVSTRPASSLSETTISDAPIKKTVKKVVKKQSKVASRAVSPIKVGADTSDIQQSPMRKVASKKVTKKVSNKKTKSKPIIKKSKKIDNSVSTSLDSTFDSVFVHKKRQSGLSLKFKFALPIMGFLILLVGVWTILNINKIEKTVENQIKLDGMSAIHLLKIYGRDILENRHSLKRMPPKKKLSFGDGLDDVEGNLPPEKRSIRYYLTERSPRLVYNLDKFRKLYQQSLENWYKERESTLTEILDYPSISKVSSLVLNADIIDLKNSHGQNPPVLQSEKKNYSIAQKSSENFIFKNGKRHNIDTSIVKISSGDYTPIVDGHLGTTERYFGFKAPITSLKTGQRIGTAMLILSGVSIDEQKNELLKYSLIIGGCAILASLLMSLMLATVVTKPVAVLTDDIQIVAGGDLNHQTIPTTNDEIGVLAYEFNIMTKQLLKAKDAEIVQHQLEHELSIATEIQNALLPKAFPVIDGCEFYAIYHPAKEVGGDYYDYIPIDDRYMGIVVADVSGKGIPGSMVMTSARMLMRLESRDNPDAHKTCIQVNHTLSREIRKGMFVTALYAILDSKTRSMQLCSAGHNPLIVYRKATNKLELFNPNGIALGFDKGLIFGKALKDVTIDFETGDFAIFYTDGVVEAMNSKREEYGEERFMALLLKLVSGSARKMVDGIYEDLEAFRGDAEQHDDITISILKFV